VVMPPTVTGRTRESGPRPVVTHRAGGLTATPPSQEDVHGCCDPRPPRTAAAADGTPVALQQHLALRSSAAADGGRCLGILDSTLVLASCCDPRPPRTAAAAAVLAANTEATFTLRSSAAADGGRCPSSSAGPGEVSGVAILGRRGRRPLLLNAPVQRTPQPVAILGRRGRRPLRVRRPRIRRVRTGVVILGRRGRRPLPLWQPVCPASSEQLRSSAAAGRRPLRRVAVTDPLPDLVAILGRRGRRPLRRTWCWGAAPPWLLRSSAAADGGRCRHPGQCRRPRRGCDPRPPRTAAAAGMLTGNPPSS